MTYKLDARPSDATIVAPPGPYDMRLGYVSLPEFSKKLANRGYIVQAQAQVSDTLGRFTRNGVFPVYREKTVAGLHIEDRHGRGMYSFSYPRRTFASYSAIPPVIRNMLLFVENRNLLDETHPYINPVIDWGRLAHAAFEAGVNLIGVDRMVPGGSTLATQLEKYRHSAGGMTWTAKDKLRQVVSASLRAYHDGPATLAARKRIVLDYINSVPLAAIPGYGEVFGLGDGLWAWYGVELDSVVKALKNENISDPQVLQDKALRLKQVLSLFLAESRPSYFLNGGRAILNDRCNAYLSLLAKEKIISHKMKSLAVQIPLTLRKDAFAAEQMSLAYRKSATPVRIRLLSMLGMEQLHDLDRLDMSVKSTLDFRAQREVTDLIMKLKDPNWTAEQGLKQEGLLAKGDPKKVIYALTMYQRTPVGNMLRVQTDNSDRALNINEGVMLDLGSSAKLRTLIHYLEIIASLYDQYGKLDRKELLAIQVTPQDAIRRWAIEFLLKKHGGTLEEMLLAAMEREYSASPNEQFFTGGGLHAFVNFDDTYDHSVISLNEGFRHSVNLVFIRLMRDIVRYHIFGTPGFAFGIEALQDPAKRGEYLTRFANFEGANFLRKFYARYNGKSEEEKFAALLHSVRLLPRRLAVIHRFVYPEKDLAAFEHFLKEMLPGSLLDEASIKALYANCSQERLSLNDAGFIAGVHPLELWLVAHMRKEPQAHWDEILKQSASVRQEAYRWLFRTSRRGAQDKRIRIILEMEAFVQIHANWKRLGYPFDSLVPSYATAIGTSADKPGSLANLMGIVQADGVRLPVHMIEEVRLGADTPYETDFGLGPEAGKRVLRKEIARVVREALYDVVRSGTARRINGAFLTSYGKEIPIGGKTGTGDHRFEVFNAAGHMIESRVVNRTATFAFILGDRFFGTITAYVPGAAASGYEFTSALPVTVLKMLAPILGSMMIEQA